MLDSSISSTVGEDDFLKLFDEFSINSYISQSTYTYSYTYIKSEVETSGSYNIIVDKYTVLEFLDRSIYFYDSETKIIKKII